jgi:ribonucleoside-diphosphate reductase alpha chain
MGMADIAISMGKAYGSSEFIEMIDKIMKTMINSALQASANNARDKGVFPRYDKHKILSSSFIKNVATKETIDIIKKHGLRNSRLLSIAPTGSISNVLGVSGGIEPYFMIYYNRTIKSMFEDDMIIQVVEKTPQELMKQLGIKDANDLPEYAKVTSQNIKFEDRARVQATVQKYVDTAISSTFNVPNEATVDDIKDIYFASWTNKLKGSTVFRDNCKKIGILTGGGVATQDQNPATPPTLEVTTIIYDKETGIKEADIETITVKDDGYEVKDVKKDVCPVCGEHLVKQGGCTKCSNNECHYEKCAL